MIAMSCAAPAQAQKATEGLILTVRDEGSPAWQFAQFLRKPDGISLGILSICVEVKLVTYGHILFFYDSFCFIELKLLTFYEMVHPLSV